MDAESGRIPWRPSPTIRNLDGFPGGPPGPFGIWMDPHTTKWDWAQFGSPSSPGSGLTGSTPPHPGAIIIILHNEITHIFPLPMSPDIFWNFLDTPDALPHGPWPVQRLILYRKYQ